MVVLFFQLIRTAKENAFHVDSLLEPRLFDNGPVLSSLVASTLVARSFLGGEFAGGESAWWRGNWIPIEVVPKAYVTAHLRRARRVQQKRSLKSTS